MRNVIALVFLLASLSALCWGRAVRLEAERRATFVESTEDFCCYYWQPFDEEQLGIASAWSGFLAFVAVSGALAWHLYPSSPYDGLTLLRLAARTD